ncbi:type I restriction enzyme StySJI specificity protein, partial [Vibrio nigripulchritudo ATCC 27043]
MSELPKGWVDSRLEESIYLNQKFSNIDDDSECGFVPMALVPTKYGAPIEFETKKWGKCKKGYTQFQNDDVLLAKITPCFENGKSALVSGLPNGIGAGSTEYFVLRSVSNLVEPKYLHAFVKTRDFLINCETNMSGSVGHRRVPKDYLLNYSMPLAPLAEQKRIVEKLDEVLAQVDTIKARLDGIPDLLKRFRQSVLASAVSGKLIAVKTPRLMTIGDVSEDIRYGTSKKCEYKGGDTPVIRIPNIGDRKLDVSDLKSADFTEKELEKLALKSGDLLVIRSNGSLDLVAKPAIVESQYEGFLYAGYLIRIRCDREKVIPSFLLNVLSSRVVRDVVELGARSTSGVNNINSKELSALEFVLPSLEE